MDKVWVIMALASEAPSLAQHPRVAVSGLGKINAAMTAARVILEHAPDVVINIGTAGGITVQSGLHQPKKFVQRDMKCEALGHDRGVTPFEPDSGIIQFGQGLVCSTGDDFVTDGSNLTPACDLVDMEAYAIAKVCQRMNTDFLCWKWVSDQADQNSAHEWQQQVKSGEQAFLDCLMPYGF